jgi:hypothetical protein
MLRREVAATGILLGNLAMSVRCSINSAACIAA